MDQLDRHEAGADPAGRVHDGQRRNRRRKLCECLGWDEVTTSRLRPEHPQHLVRITQPLYLGIHEVSQEHYEPVESESQRAQGAAESGRVRILGRRSCLL